LCDAAQTSQFLFIVRPEPAKYSVRLATREQLWRAVSG